MKDFWEEQTPTKKTLNKTKLTVSIVLTVIIIGVITLIILYNTSYDFRNWTDKNILNKEILQDATTTIELDDENSKIYAFNKNVGILSKNKFKVYNNQGNKETELDMEITNPIFSSSNRFVAIGENGGKKIYLIEDKKISWEQDVEGAISQIHVNKNGYVAAVITGTSHKSVVAIFDNKGTPLFKTYFANTRIADVNISNDNKHLAIAEIDTSGTMIQSNIKIISMEKAQSDSTNSMEKTYSGKINSLIIDIKYQDNDKLICMYDDSIHMIADEKDEILADYSNQKINFNSIELNNNIVNVKEQSSGLFTADSIVNIVNTGNRNVKTYQTDSVTKEIKTYENIIALNLGTEIEFINTDGWLVKRYIAKQEITNIVLSNSIACIVYRDKVEIINL